jgi:hypothetical protein
MSPAGNYLLPCSGADELLIRPRARGLLGSRTANRMAGHRALPLGSRVPSTTTTSQHRPINGDNVHQPTVFCGIDWASNHHDIAVIDDTGALLSTDAEKWIWPTFRDGG